MKTKLQLLLHPFFLCSLVLLLVNDLYLKYEFHNWFTGKLSDFAGLLVFATFLIVFFPFRKKMTLVACALFFCWWKSSLSNSFIWLLNDNLSLLLQRVVDYTDFFALLVLPFVYKLKEPVYPVSFTRSLAVYAVGIISFFSFCATSIARHMIYDPYIENEVSYYESFTSPLTEKEILERLDPEKKGYQKDSVKYYRIRENEDFYYRLKKRDDSTITWLPLKNTGDSALFVKREVPVHFLIPRYILQGDTLYKLALRIYHNPRKRRNPRTIEIISFETNNSPLYRDFYLSKTRKQYTKHFKALFR